MGEAAKIRGRVKQEMNRINKKKKEQIAELKKADTMKIRFQNLEAQNVPLEFTYINKKYHLIDGMVYELPEPVVKHIISLRIPVYRRKEELDEDGKVQKELVGMRNRFACSVVFDEDIQILKEVALKQKEANEKNKDKKDEKEKEVASK